MGTYAGIFSGGGSIPENKREEFSKRLERLFQTGGMMEIEGVQLYGKTVRTIRKVTMHEYGMRFNYNYFEDSIWERAGFDRKDCHVISGKIGGIDFYKTIIAAYVLEEIYTEGVAIATVDGEPVVSCAYVAWINYLFGEKRNIKNFDPWKLYETFIDTGRDLPYYSRWKDFGYQGYSLIDGCEIYAVIYGVDNALSIYEEKVKGELEKFAIDGMKLLWRSLKSFKAKSELDKKEQLKVLLHLFQIYCDKGPRAEEFQELEDELKAIFMGLRMSDASAFLIKAISEIYEEEFWDLWGKIRDIAERKSEDIYGKEWYHVPPMPTQEFFFRSPDDMIIYWKKGDFEFSEELWQWFDELRKRYDKIVLQNLFIDKPIKYVIDLMEEAEDNYYRIYTFKDFFEETIENLNDIRFLASWKLYEEILRDPEIKTAGDVIFVPGGREYENYGLRYWGEGSKRRLLHNWDVMDFDKQNNMARVTLKRYMALMANKELRAQVFGF